MKEIVTSNAKDKYLLITAWDSDRSIADNAIIRLDKEFGQLLQRCQSAIATLNGLEFSSFVLTNNNCIFLSKEFESGVFRISETPYNGEVIDLTNEQYDEILEKYSIDFDWDLELSVHSLSFRFITYSDEYFDSRRVHFETEYISIDRAVKAINELD